MDELALRAKALSLVAIGAQRAAAQACFDEGQALHERGGAHAERAFSALVWAHSLLVSESALETVERRAAR